MQRCDASRNVLDIQTDLKNIRNMPNLSKKSSSDARRRFVDDVTALLVPWGMPQMSARIYGYLLLHSHPVSLDQLTRDMEISKSTASVAARLLESHMLIKRKAEKGTKRVFYVISDSSSGLLTEKSNLLGEFGRLLETRADEVAIGDAASKMRAIGRFYLSMREAIDKLVRELSIEQEESQKRTDAGAGMH